MDYKTNEHTCWAHRFDNEAEAKLAAAKLNGDFEVVKPFNHHLLKVKGKTEYVGYLTNEDMDIILGIEEADEDEDFDPVYDAQCQKADFEYSAQRNGDYA